MRKGETGICSSGQPGKGDEISIRDYRSFITNQAAKLNAMSSLLILFYHFLLRNRHSRKRDTSLHAHLHKLSSVLNSQAAHILRCSS